MLHAHRCRRLVAAYLAARIVRIWQARGDKTASGNEQQPSENNHNGSGAREQR